MLHCSLNGFQAPGLNCHRFCTRDAGGETRVVSTVCGR
jgi:hypothetical protein